MPEKLIRSTSEFIDTINSPAFMMGLLNAPVTPWYFGQPDTGGKLVPGLYKSGIDPSLERELLREFRLLTAEFASLKGQPDADVMIAAHQGTVPSRIIEWQGNALAALFLAVESMAADKHGKIWILNPWTMNELCAQLSLVPSTDSDYFKKYVVALNDPEASPTPEATLPLAFKPYRVNRPYNTQAVGFTVHGSSPAPIEELKFFMKKATAFLSHILVEGERKRLIMKELHNLGVTRASLFPGAPSTVRTLVYRYSEAYLKTPL
jgi:hypothetical protein